MNPPSLIRRRLVLAGAALVSLPACAAESREIAHRPWGAIEPAEAAPDIDVSLADGTRGRLVDLLRGKTSAIQFVFTGCSATCSLQGAIFQSLQAQLARHPIGGAQLLSISIDPANDTAVAMTAWLRRFGAQPGWQAAIPASGDLARLARLARLYRDERNPADSHIDQAFISSRSARFVWKTDHLPTPESVHDALRYYASH